MKTTTRKTLELVLLSSVTALAACADGSGSDPFDPQDPANGVVGADPTGELPPPIIVDPGDKPGTPAGPAVFASKQVMAANLVIADGSLYWTDFEDNTAKLRWVHLDGGDWLTVRDLDSLPFAAAADDAGLYLSASSEQNILFAPLLGLEPTTLHSSVTDPLALALDDDFAYWTAADGCVSRGAKEGGDPEPVACGDGGPISMALTTDYVYWATLEGSLYRAPKAANVQAEKLASGESFAAGIIVDDARVYWVNDTTRQVRSLMQSTGFVDVLADAQYAPAGITQDRYYLYFTTQGEGAVKRLSKSGGTAQTLTSQQSLPSEIIADEEFLYWVNEGNGTVMRLVKE